MPLIVPVVCESEGSRARNNQKAGLELQQPDHSVYHVELRLSCRPFPDDLGGLPEPAFMAAFFSSSPEGAIYRRSESVEGR